MIWLTSDCHFGHKKILEYSPKTRSYTSVDEMDKSMIDTWNRMVAPEDTVYILGDISFYGVQRTIEIVKQLNGQLHLIKGNHDYKLCENAEFRNLFVSVQDYLEIKHLKTKIVLCHYPILEWNGCHRNSMHCYGHLHNGKSGLEKYKAMDVGVDATGQLLISLDDCIKILSTRKVKEHGIRPLWYRIKQLLRFKHD